jgi:hypothetical protein
MGIVDPGWVGRLSGVGILVGLAGLFYVGHWLEKKLGWKNYSRGLGRGLLDVETVLRPSKAYVREANERQRKTHDDNGGPDDPGKPST